MGLQRYALILQSRFVSLSLVSLIVSFAFLEPYSLKIKYQANQNYINNEFESTCKKALNGQDLKNKMNELMKSINDQSISTSKTILDYKYLKIVSPTSTLLQNNDIPYLYLNTNNKKIPFACFWDNTLNKPKFLESIDEKTFGINSRSKITLHDEEVLSVLKKDGKNFTTVYEQKLDKYKKINSKGKPFVYCAEKCGVMDSTGFWIVEPKYDNYIFNPNARLQIIKENNKLGLVDNSGNIVIKPIYEIIYDFKNDGLAAVKQNGKWGLIDSSGKIIIPIIYDSISHREEDVFVKVNLNKKSGFIDKKGKIVVPIVYDGVYIFNNGLAAVKQNEKWGFIDKKGKVVVPIIYDSVNSYKENIAAVKQNGKWGFINKKGKIVVPIIYDSVNSYKENIVSVKQNGKWGFIDKKGKVVIPNKFDYAGSFYNGVAILKIKDKWGIINTKNEIILPFEYDKIYVNDSNYFTLKNNKYGYVDLNTNFIISNKYDQEFLFMSNGLATVKQNNKWGVINKKGEIVVPFEFLEIEYITNDIFEMKHEKKGWATYDIATGKIVAIYKKNGSCGSKNQILNANYETIWPKNHQELCEKENEKYNKEAKLRDEQIEKDLKEGIDYVLKANAVKLKNAFVCRSREDLLTALSLKKSIDPMAKTRLLLLNCEYLNETVTTKGKSVGIYDSSWGNIAKITDGINTIYTKESEISIIKNNVVKNDDLKRKCATLLGNFGAWSACMKKEKNVFSMGKKGLKAYYAIRKDCNSLSSVDSGLSYLCKNPTSSACASLNAPQSTINACYGCKGSNLWLRVYAMGVVLQCY